MNLSCRPSRPFRHCLGVLALVGTAVAHAEAPLDPPRQYLVRGEGRASIAGAHCCGDTNFTGRFEAGYQIESSGLVQLVSLRIALDDADVVVRDGFLGLFDGRAQVRCASAWSVTTTSGTLTAPILLRFPAGALKLSGISSEARLGDGACAEPTIEMAAVNDTDAVVLHDPVGDRFSLAGTFHSDIAGESFTLDLSLAGRFSNRPPEAMLALRRLDEPFPQGGCPAFLHWNVQQKRWEWVAEANTPEGLKGAVHSFSTDPDAGYWSQGDVLGERWFDTLGDGARGLLGAGRDVDDLVFGWGLPHHVELLAIDHQGASSAASCSFRVIDTRPPVVTPPGPKVTGCSTVGGATGATSPAVRGFLEGAGATDAVDPAPAALAPQVGGIDVGLSTLFPADSVARAVSFSFRDGSGNVGAATAALTVRDVVPPVATASATPHALAADFKWWWITTALSASDDCGRPVTFRLLSIVSTASAFDASDIYGAAFGTDDRGFYLFSRPAAAGLARIYTITYEARDAAGNIRLAQTPVTVG